VHAPLREPVPDARQDILRRAHIARRHLVRDVDECGAVHLGQQHALHLAHVAVGAAKVGEQSDEGRHRRQTVARRQAPLSQNMAMTIPRATAVTQSASPIPTSPMALDDHAASGTRRRVSVDLATWVYSLYTAPSRAASCAPRFCPTRAEAESANPEMAMKPTPSTLCPTPSAASARYRSGTCTA